MNVLADLELARHPITPEDLSAVCDLHGIARRDIRRAWLIFHPESDRFGLTEDGLRLAAAWRSVNDPDPAARFDAAYWPTEAPAGNQSKWDWEDDPDELHGTLVPKQDASTSGSVA